MASGWFAGAGAARHARQRGTRRAVGQALGQAGLRPAAAARPVDHAALVESVRAETIPLDRNFFRTGNGLAAGRERLEGVWAEIRKALLQKSRSWGDSVYEPLLLGFLYD